jgi:hypothetical protein
LSSDLRRAEGVGDGDEVSFPGGSREGFGLALDPIGRGIVAVDGQDAHHLIGTVGHPWELFVVVDGLADGEFGGHDMTASLAFCSGQVRKVFSRTGSFIGGCERISS